MADIADLIVVGAGPAGLSAAVTAADHGQHVVLIDAGIQTGGQYWRHPDERFPVADESHGHHGWKVFSTLRDRLYGHERNGLINYRRRTQVWFVEQPASRTSPWVVQTNSVDDTYRQNWSVQGTQANRLVLCPGGYDRQLPVPGWDLPGAMAAGGVQALLKGSGTLAGRKAIVAGTGPFLFPVAVGLAEAGAEVLGICEATNLSGWAKNITRAAQMPSKGIEGAEYAGALIKHRIPYKPRTVVSAIHGEHEVESVTLTKVSNTGRLRPGTEATLEVDLVATGWGFTPSMELVQATGAKTRIDIDESLIAVVDSMQRSTADRVYVAGEATGVGGASMAVAEGRLAALSAVKDSNQDVPPSQVKKLQSFIRRSSKFAQAMHQAHPVPAHWQEWLTDDTTICRCEEVTYQQVRQARDDLHAEEARSVKLTVRPGMGWCQGRICGFACAKIAAESETREMSTADLASVSKRTVAAPITLNDLGGIDPENPL